MFDNKKAGVIGIWIGVMFGIFLLGTIYIAGSDAWDKVYDKFYAAIPAEYQSTAEKANSIWKNFPIFGSIALLLAGVYFTYKQQDITTGPYG